MLEYLVVNTDVNSNTMYIDFCIFYLLSTSGATGNFCRNFVKPDAVCLLAAADPRHRKEAASGLASRAERAKRLLNKLGICHKRQRRKRQPVTAKREKSQTPKVLTAILT